MATAEQHRKQAASNLNFINDIEQQEATRQYFDWKITVLFYVALHELHIAFNDYKGSCCPTLDSHYKIDNELKGDDHLKPLRNPYQKLFNLCLAARYSCSQMTSVEYARANTYYGEFKERLKKIS